MQREKRRELREAEARGNEIKEKRRPLFAKLNENKENIRQTEQQLKSLDSQAGQQEQKLKSLSHDTYRAYQWVKGNQNRFEKEVFGPPIVSCSVTDPKYADAVESMFQRNDFVAFTTQSRSDFRVLQKALADMRMSDVSIRTCSIPLERFPPPMSEGELKELGFDCWARDVLTGPDPVIALLCSENRLNSTPICLRNISEAEYHRMENGPLTTWVAGKQAYQVNRRREYGPNATSTRVRPVRPARVWTSQPVDGSARQELERTIMELNDGIREVQETMDVDKAEITQLKETYQENERARVRSTLQFRAELTPAGRA